MSMEVPSGNSCVPLTAYSPYSGYLSSLRGGGI